ncbi:hypothetical protein RO3G_04728 [Rhizopus delemar RA 99-880]|uniref:Uncharacterized protein n=1 Tax=Rhizopus delemar (strain RA 99-880 / ATCC MYA-4621 / FGSC 9543 / NRRL 43880) TaxID=246409 RepID=I1BUZ3_RHIO9|nr:hypothetical protein RO3G_04728 [Rhizopus delemar RA 99-880]|eukprot:EIE80023.1 hypothetical protein RO3G_04728 [Rhizopus delemar RA 99-880]
MSARESFQCLTEKIKPEDSLGGSSKVVHKMSHQECPVSILPQLPTILSYMFQLFSLAIRALLYSLYKVNH